MDILLILYITGGFLAVISYFLGKFVSKVFPVESKIFAGITSIIFLLLSLLILSLGTGVSVPDLYSESSLYFLYAMIMVGGYTGFLSSFSNKTSDSDLTD